MSVECIDHFTQSIHEMDIDSAVEPTDGQWDVIYDDDDDDVDDNERDELDEVNEITSTNMKRLQTGIFNAWVENQLSNPSKSVKTADGVASGEVGPSIKDIIGQTGSQTIIQDAREYQLELFERAKRENTIAVLDTGTGKTLIAILLLRYIIELELDDRAQGKPARLAFFLVPSVNLVFQQFGVLQTNLDYEAVKIYGALGVDLWNREKWDKLFLENKIIVCTPEVLHMCLGHGFVRMDQINLLIFDEAHHAKLSHPYSKILRDYYVSLEENQRPRIFGMTASPVDVKADNEDVQSAASNLENILHSKIATISTQHLGRFTSKPEEKLEVYPPIPYPSGTRLRNEIVNRYGHFPFVQAMAERADRINAHLGSWCADTYWQVALTDRVQRMSVTFLYKYTQRVGDDTVDDEKKMIDLAQLNELVEYVHSVNRLNPCLQGNDISAKVKALYASLKEYFVRPTNCSCIVFVDERYTATLLHRLFSCLKDEFHLKSAALMATGRYDALGETTTLREQALNVLHFRKGELNCLFATSVAEEGLDIPACNLVVRFDPCKTMIQYIQSRGRARHSNSTFVHMIEAGNDIHQAMLEDNQRSEHIMRAVCAGLPPDRYLTGQDDPDSGFVDPGIKPYINPTTGAKLTASNCMVILAHFVSALPNSEEEPLRPMYVVQADQGGFDCEVVLPACSPLHRMQGNVKRRKKFARISAAFHACIELIKMGLLDSHFLPIYKDRASVLRQVELGLGMKGAASYKMRMKPDFWSSGIPETLYATTVDFSAGLERPHQSLVILTRKALPHFPSFPLFLLKGYSTTVKAKSLEVSFSIDSYKLELLTKFAIAVYKDVFNKTYEHDSNNMSYWFAPFKVQPILASNTPRIDDIIDWEAMRRVCDSPMIPWTSEIDSTELIDKFIIDPLNGAKRYFTVGCMQMLCCYDKNPLFDGQDKSPSIIESSTSRRTVDNMTWNKDQPVFKAERVVHRQNMLSEEEVSSLQDKSAAYICLEPLFISQISTAFAETCLALPPVIHRLESYLIALEACDRLGLALEPSLALEVFTKDSTVDDEAEEADPSSTTKFHRGMGPNYERLEFLGDTFLKMATSIAVYIKNPADTEWDFHIKRAIQLCNSNLFQVGTQLGTPEYIRTQPFSRRTWYPERLKLLAGKGHTRSQNPRYSHVLGHKTIADVSEAMIGAVLLSQNGDNEALGSKWNSKSWAEVVATVSMVVKSEVHDMSCWEDYAKCYTASNWQLVSPRVWELDLVRKISLVDDYTFKSARLLHAVFTHPSMPRTYDDVRDYQQLEFLGDSLLDLACVLHLFYRYTDKDPQWLTEHKGAMVTNKFLAAVCVKLEFHKHLRYTTNGLGSQIAAYILDLQEAQSKTNLPDYWLMPNDPPKCLADVMEAYIGALFVDSGFNFGQIQRFFTSHIEPFFVDMTLYDTFANNHPQTRLESLLSNTLGCNRYRMMIHEVPSVEVGAKESIVGLMIHKTVIAGDQSKSSKYGQVRCANKALAQLETMSKKKFKAMFNCDCSETDLDELEVV